LEILEEDRLSDSSRWGLSSMTVSIGFVLITHSKPEQIRRLIDRLNTMFDRPPIVCHHDFGQCDLPVEAFLGNVSFVRPSLPSGWGVFSVVEATVRAIRQMYEVPGSPDWFVLLSGADYPIKPAAQVRRELAAGSYDAYIEDIPIRADHFKTGRGRAIARREATLMEGMFLADWQRLCYDRFCAKRLRLRPTCRVLTLKHPLLTRPFLPFSARFRCYAGSQWFCANHRAAEYILHYHATRPALASHYKRFWFSEESYFQCILVNAPDIKVSNNNYRYTDWPLGGAHPKPSASRISPSCCPRRPTSPGSSTSTGTPGSWMSSTTSLGKVPPRRCNRFCPGRARGSPESWVSGLRGLEKPWGNGALRRASEK